MSNAAIDCLLLHIPDMRHRTGFAMLSAMGLFSLGDNLHRRGYSARILHLGVERIIDNNFSLKAYFNRRPAGVAALSLHWHHQSASTLLAAGDIKAVRPGVPVVLGGFTASFFADEILREHGNVDFIIRGDGEAPLLTLVKELKKDKPAYSTVPNLSWRRRGKVIHNEQAYVATAAELNELSFSNFHLMENFPVYTRLPLSVSNFSTASLNDYRMFCLFVGRGCPVKCTFCGGSCSSQRMINNREAVALRSPEAVLETVKEAASEGIEYLYVSFDPEPGGQYYKKLFRMIRKSRVKIGMIFECWSLPTMGFIDDFRKTFGGMAGSAIVLSPETGSERLRKLHKGYFYTNSELLHTVERLHEKEISSQVWFTYPLPFETSKDLRDTRNLMAMLKRKLGPWGKVIAMEYELDPGSPLFNQPDHYGVSLRATTFSDYCDPHRRTKFGVRGSKRQEVERIYQEFLLSTTAMNDKENEKVGGNEAKAALENSRDGRDFEVHSDAMSQGYARLGRQWLLRGWSEIPFAAVNWTNGRRIRLDRELFDAARVSDGKTSLASIAFRSRLRLPLKNLMEAGVVEACHWADPIDSRQRFRKANNPAIIGIRWCVTGRCNLNCLHCNVEAPQGRYGEPSLRQMMGLIGQMEQANVCGVALTGGEPLLREDLPELIGTLVKKRFHVSEIFTNGVLVTRGILEHIRDTGARPKFQVSFDGLGAHDRMRGKRGIEERVIQAIKKIRIAGFPVDVATCIDRDSMDRMPATYTLLKELDIGAWHIGPPQRTGNWRRSTTGISLEEEANVYGRLLDCWVGDGQPFDIQLGGFFHGSTQGEMPVSPCGRPGLTAESFDCHACGDLPCLLPDGTLLPCGLFIDTAVQDRMPNLFREELSRAWRKSFLRRILDMKKAERLAKNGDCSTCKSFGDCGMGCMAIAVTETEDLFYRDPISCAIWKSGYPEQFQERIADRPRGRIRIEDLPASSGKGRGSRNADAPVSS